VDDLPQPVDVVGSFEQREVLRLAAGGRGRSAGMPAEDDPRRLGPAVPGGLLVLGPGRRPGLKARSTLHAI
jgi:hypothetical protein